MAGALAYLEGRRANVQAQITPLLTKAAFGSPPFGQGTNPSA